MICTSKDEVFHEHGALEIFVVRVKRGNSCELDCCHDVCKSAKFCWDAKNLKCLKPVAEFRSEQARGSALKHLHGQWNTLGLGNAISCFSKYSRTNHQKLCSDW